jgi:hypothetical protein
MRDEGGGVREEGGERREDTIGRREWLGSNGQFT